MVRIHLPINGKYYLWYEVDEERNVKWYLPRDEAPEDLRSNQPTFFATTTSLPFCAEYSQVERVMTVSYTHLL